MFRLLAAIMVPVLLLGVFEIGLRLTGVGHSTAFLVPYRTQGESYHGDNPKFGWRFFGPRMARTSLPLAIRDAKPAGTCRIFVFGESAAYGDPLPAFGLARHLEVLLRARFPHTRFEVVNVAMTGINSHGILPIARACAKRNGDVWVVYMGNNEVVGPFGAGTVFGAQAPALAAIRARLALKATRTGQAIAALRERLKPSWNSTSEWGGMRLFLDHRVQSDDPRMATAYAHFESNLNAIIRAGVDRGVRVVISTVASNLRDCAPFASMHRPQLAGALGALWERDFQAGLEAQRAGEPGQAIERFRKASAQDDGFAELEFAWGQCSLALGETEEARRHFARARDLDTLRFRCDSRLNAIIRRTAQGREREGVFFADGEGALAQESPDGLTGAEMFYEHVHLRFEGNYLLARSLAAQVARALPVTATREAEAEWLGLEACARQLGWADWSRHEGAAQMLSRLADAPFTTQSNHGAQRRRLIEEVTKTRPGTQPTALREAVAWHRELLDRAPDDVWLLENLGRLELRLGNASSAAEAWRRLAALRPRYAEARVQFGRCLALAERYDEAKQAFTAVLRADPDSITAREGLAFIHAQRGEHEAVAVQHEAILERRPLYSPSRLALGMLLAQLGRAEAARQQYRLAAAHPLNTAPALRAVGVMCLEQGWLAEAVTNLTRSLRLDPTAAVTHLRLGQTLAGLQRHLEAAASYAEAVQWDPGLAEAHFRLGFERGRQGKDREALERFATAVRLDPDMLQARLNLGIAAFRHGQFAEARTQFEEVLRRDSTNALARQYLGRLPAIDAPLR